MKRQKNVKIILETIYKNLQSRKFLKFKSRRFKTV